MKPDTFLAEVERFLKTYDISATRFGVLAAGDTKFVKTLRAGRKCRLKTQVAVRKFIQEASRAK